MPDRREYECLLAHCKEFLPTYVKNHPGELFLITQRTMLRVTRFYRNESKLGEDIKKRNLAELDIPYIAGRVPREFDKSIDVTGLLLDVERVKSILSQP